MKKMKNFALAAIVGLAIGLQAVVPVEAAQISELHTARAWVCGICGASVYVTEVPKFIRTVTPKKYKCTTPGHVSSCWIDEDIYVDEYHITCTNPNCGISYWQNSGSEYLKLTHRSYD